MNLSEEQLTAIEELAGLFYTPMEIATIIEADSDEFESVVRAGRGAVFDAYYTGYYRADMALRKSITDSALQGSSPAQALLRDIQKLSKIAI